MLHILKIYSVAAPEALSTLVLKSRLHDIPAGQSNGMPLIRSINAYAAESLNSCIHILALQNLYNPLYTILY